MSDNKNTYDFDDELLTNLDKLKKKYSAFDDPDMTEQNPSNDDENTKGSSDDGNIDQDVSEVSSDNNDVQNDEETFAFVEEDIPTEENESRDIYSYSSAEEQAKDEAESEDAVTPIAEENNIAEPTVEGEDLTEEFEPEAESDQSDFYDDDNEFDDDVRELYHELYEDDDFDDLDSVPLVRSTD